MIKENELREFRPTYQYENGTEVTLEGIKEAIQNMADQAQIPVAFENDQIKYGSLFNSQLVDCVVLYHPEHKKDYYKLAISVKRIGNVAYVAVNDFGISKNEIKLSARDNAKINAKSGAKFAIKDAENGADMMGALFTMGKGALGGLISLGGSKRKQEEENMYYNALVMILDQVIC